MAQTKAKTPKIHEPLFHIVKRDRIPTWKSLMIRLLAIALGFILCGLICWIVLDLDPVKFYSTMISGVFKSPRRMWKMAKNLSVLLCISLAVTPAFKMKFWNIGAEGQVLMSCLASVACIVYMGGKLPNWALLIFMAAASIMMGSVWAVIPAIFKANWNTNETLFTLMMNYVATLFVSFCLIVWVPSGSTTLGEQAHGQLPQVIHPYFLLVVIVALITVAMHIYLNYFKQGYEISVVGESQKTACYIGINVKKVVIRTLIVSGALCGVAGFLIVSALDHSVTTTSVGGQGFTAIMVSWLAKFNPLVMVATAFLIVFLQQGVDQVATDCGISNAFPNIIEGIVLFFVIGCEFFINYRIVLRGKEKAEK
ncbi:MAG: ABC transporter permease [Clostridia bacterium]|nr:ABC transporter permease [Clostridia bacterium]